MTTDARARGSRSTRPSIRARLANALLIWSIAWGLAAGAAVWLAATHEVDELLDDTLRSSTEVLAVLVRSAVSQGTSVAAPPNGAEDSERFAWQVVSADGTVLVRSSRAPATPWRSTPSSGFGDVTHWRLFGLSLGASGHTLYAAQSHDERREARAEVALSATLAALAVGLLGHFWLRTRIRTELHPLQSLSRKLREWKIEAPDAAAALGTPEREELEPVHGALEALAARLAVHVGNERAFSAHAAHALRTPLAGIDAQLAVALRECPEAMRPRLDRVRGAAATLQGVVAGMLALFRANGARRSERIDVRTLLSQLAAPALVVEIAPDTHVHGDPELVAAALLNVLDNAQRHGAARAWVEPLAPNGLRVRDDGPGVSPERREALQAALEAQSYQGVTGLGLMMTDRVARAHGGRVRLPATGSGFTIDVELDGEREDT